MPTDIVEIGLAVVGDFKLNAALCGSAQHRGAGLGPGRGIRVINLPRFFQTWFGRHVVEGQAAHFLGVVVIQDAGPLQLAKPPYTPLDATLWHLYGRTVDPVAFAEGRWPRTPLLAYFMLTETGLAILGYALLGRNLPMSIGWTFIGSMVLLFVLTLIYRDMVPLMFYLVTLIAGIALLALGTRQRLGGPLRR